MVINSESRVASLVLLACSAVFSTDEETTDIHILGLFTFNGIWQGGLANLPAALTAVADINERQDILLGYRLVMHWNDTSCDGGVSTNALFYQLYRPPTKIMAIGGGCSVATEPAAKASHHWNLVHMGYSSSSPALTDKKIFPLFLRTYSTENLANPARMAVMDMFNWKRIAVIQKSYPVFAATTDDLRSRIVDTNITIITTEIFTNNPALQIENLKDQDARIIILGGYQAEAMQVFCEAYKAGLYGARYVWMIVGWFTKQFWLESYEGIDCPGPAMQDVLEGTLTFSFATFNPIEKVGLAGMTSDQFRERMLNVVGDPNTPGMVENPTVYDGVWAMALALNKTAADLRHNGSQRNIEDFHYGDTEMASLLWKNSINTRFEGIKGVVSFDENGDSASAVEIGQIQSGVQELVGIFFPTTRDIKWNPEKTVKWQGGSAPKDSTTHLIEPAFVPWTIYVVMCCCAGVGILLACGLLAFNVHFRKNRLIKMSSPVMNNIILVGCIVTYITVFLQELSPDNMTLFCKLRVFTVMAGYSLSFGALFSKTWRVYVIFTNTTQKVILRDIQLVLVVAVLLVIDIIVFVIRQVVDPEYVTRTIEVVGEYDGGDLVVESEIFFCTSNYGLYFQGVIYTYKGLMLVFGAFLAWQTRKVTIAALNDSQYIGMCIYNVTILSILGVILAFALEGQIQLQYVLTSTFLMFGTLAIQLIIFIPKLLKLRALGGQVDPADEQAETSTQFSNVSKAGITLPIGADHAGLEEELKEAKAELAKLKAEMEKCDKDKG